MVVPSRRIEFAMVLKVKLIGIVFFLSLTIGGLAQSYELEKLKEKVASQPDDSTKVNDLISLGIEFYGVDPKESVRYGEQAATLASKLHFSTGLGYAYKTTGLGYYFQSNYPEAVTQFQNSLAVFDSLNYKDGVANILSLLGSTYFNVGDNTKAIEFQLRSLKISEELGDSVRIGTALNGIGAAYNNNDATVDKALEYFLKALPIFIAIDYQDGVGIVAMNVGEIYKKKKLYETAIYYLDESLEVYRNTIDATFPLNMLGDVYAEQGNFEEALLYQNKALEIARGLDAKLEIAQSSLAIAKTKRKQKKFKESIPYFQNTEKLAKEIDAKIQLKEAYEGLAKSYARIGDYKNAYAYDTLFSSIKDTLYNTDNDKKIQQFQFNYNLEKKENEIDLLTKDKELKEATIQRQKILNYAAAITGFLLLLVIGGFYNRYKYVQRTNKIIKDERDRSKDLLLNILPAETARELETNGFAKTQYYESATVLFTDFKGFSTIAGKLTPQALVAELNDFFGKFDEIVEKYGLEKIKTIGDAYMCAGGIPLATETHALHSVLAALEMQEYMQKQIEDRKSRGEQIWELRIGIHTGPILTGVVGKKKYAYDIWGDTVNVASRMESSGEAGKVNISSTTFQLIKDKYACTHRGKISAKNIGEVDMYFIDKKLESTEAVPQLG